MASFEQRPTGSLIASRSWQSLFLALRVMPLLFISAIILSAIVEAGIFFLPGVARFAIYSNHVHITPENAALYFVIKIITALFWSTIAVPVAVAMHRFILLDQPTPGIISFLPRHTRQFLAWAAALQLLSSAQDFAMDWLKAIPFVGLLLGLATGLLFLIISFHVAMIFPAVAVESPSENWRLRIAKSWSQMRGRSWLLFRAGLMAALPFLLVYIVFWILLGGLYGSIHGAVRPESRLGLTFLLAVATPVAAGLCASVASWLYAWVSQPQDEAPISQAI